MIEHERRSKPMIYHGMPVIPFEDLMARAKDGDRNVQLQLGCALIREADDGEFSLRTAAYWLRQASADGDPLAQYMLAVCERKAGNDECALEIIRELVEQAYAPAITWLAQLNFSGCLIPKNEHNALELFKRASDLGHICARSRYHLTSSKRASNLATRVLEILKGIRWAWTGTRIMSKNLLDERVLLPAAFLPFEE